MLVLYEVSRIPSAVSGALGNVMCGVTPVALVIDFDGFPFYSLEGFSLNQSLALLKFLTGQ